MADQTPSLATLSTVIRDGVENRIKDLHTSMPGIIVSFDAATQTATVQPAIRRVFITRDETIQILSPTDLPVLINVPIIYPRGGGFSLTFPVAVDDECLIVFCERSIDNWHTNGGINDPLARRFHALSDAVAHVGLSSLPNVVPNYDAVNAQLRSDSSNAVVSLADATINIDATGQITITSGANVTVNAPSITLNGDTTINGTLNVSGTATAPTVVANNSLTVQGLEMATHRHSGVDTGSGTSGGPV